MMQPAVVSVHRAHHGLATLLLPDVAEDIITTADRVYLFYSTQHGADLVCVDPIDGETLIEVRFFRCASDAREWVATDIALRAARPMGVQ